MQSLHLHCNLLASHGLDQQETLNWLESAKREILPDVILGQVISSHLFSAITSPMRQYYQRQMQFCIRTWLRLSEESSPDVISCVTEGREILNEEHVVPDKVNDLPRESRFQLYR